MLVLELVAFLFLELYEKHVDALYSEPLSLDKMSRAMSRP